jgi:hypothetical protein
MRWTVVWVLLAGVFLGSVLVACRAARPTYEYEAPITITHTDAPAATVAPGDTAPPAETATSTTVPARPSSWVRGGTPK